MKKNRKKIIVAVVVIIFAVLLIIMALTNPGKDEHYQAVKDGVTVVIKNEIKDFPLPESITNAGLTAAMGFMDDYLDRKMVVKDYVVFSLGLVTYKGQQLPISVGVFNNVFLTAGYEELEKVAKSPEVLELININDVKALIDSYIKRNQE